MNTTYLDWIRENGDPSNARMLFGVIPAYPMFMFAGIVAVIIASIIKLKRRGIPLREFEVGIMIVVPAGIMGGTIFGKIFIPNMVWYHIFAFWEPGMSLFGALFVGSLCGFVWFYRRSRNTLISIWVYADCIIPNILLGQAIGRWGNFFNHEILGQAVSYESLNWLPSFIKNELFYFPNLNDFKLDSDWFNKLDEISTIIGVNGKSLKDVLDVPIVYHSPLFLIESFFNLIMWGLITFALPFGQHLLSKVKPWQLEPKAYPGWYNKAYHSLESKQIIEHDTSIPIKYSKVGQNFGPIKAKSIEIDEPKLKLSLDKTWKKAYYWQSLTETESRHFEDLAIKEEQNRETDYNRYRKQVLLNRRQKIKLKKKIDFWANYQMKSWKIRWQGKPYGRDLEKANNPNGYQPLRCGVQTSYYLIGYLILRIILETQRQTTELMIVQQPIIDFILLSFILLFAITLLVFAQWIAPYRYREAGWLYEKSY